MYPNEFGQVWYYFEQDLDYPLSIFDREDVMDVFEGGYDILVLPEGRYGFSEEEIQAMADWVSGGGKLIAIGSANGSLAGKEAFGLKEKDAPRIRSRKRRSGKNGCSPTAARNGGSSKASSPVPLSRWRWTLPTR